MPKLQRVILSIFILLCPTLLNIYVANAAPNYVFPIEGCSVKFSQAHHDYAATDILAKRGCQFVSPVNGVIDEIALVDKWSGKTNLGNDRGGWP